VTTRPLAVTLGLLSACAFLVSAGALTEFASCHKMAFPWLFPAMLDGGILGLSYAAYRASVTGRGHVTYSGLVAAFTAVSVTFNVSHVWHMRDTMTSVAHGTPPVILWVLFEVLLSELRHDSVTRRSPKHVTRDTTVSPKRDTTASTPVTQLAKETGVSVRTMYRRMAKSVTPKTAQPTASKPAPPRAA